MTDSAADESREQDLKFVLSQCTRPWAEQYFDLIASIYDLMVTDAADPRISVTMRKNSPDIFVSINNRWVLQPVIGMLEEQLIESAGVILSDNFRQTIPEGQLKLEPWQFKRRGKETRAPWLIRFEDFSFTRNEAVMSDWRRTMVETLAFGARSANRKFHNPLLSSLALDAGARKNFFDDIKWAE